MNFNFCWFHSAVAMRRVEAFLNRKFCTMEPTEFNAIFDNSTYPCCDFVYRKLCHKEITDQRNDCNSYRNHRKFTVNCIIETPIIDIKNGTKLIRTFNRKF